VRGTTKTRLDCEIDEYHRDESSLVRDRRGRSFVSLFWQVEMEMTREEMVKAKIAPGLRDNCAHLVVPLNRCRRETFYAPWKCNDERHGYEKCLYEEYVIV